MDGKSLDGSASRSTRDAEDTNADAVFARTTDTSNATTGLKRSLRLSEKRMYRNRPADVRSDNANNKRNKRPQTETPRSDKPEPGKPVAAAGNEAPDRVCHPSEVSAKDDATAADEPPDGPRASTSAVADSEATVQTPAKRSARTTAGRKTSRESASDDGDDDVFAFKRKRGRPSLRDAPKTDRADGRLRSTKTANLAVIVDKLRDGSKRVGKPDGAAATPESGENPPGADQTRGPDAVTVGDDGPPPDAAEVAGPFDEAIETSAEKSAETSALESPAGTLRRELRLLSKRFGIPFETLGNMIAEDSLSVFRDRYSDSVRPSAVTVSPVVGAESDVRYRIEPIRRSEAVEKTNLKDLMAELTKTMPSWALSVVGGPPRYVIFHTSVDPYGAPVADKSVVLDRYFRASVYVDRRLEYKYCGRYKTAAEIVNLVMRLDAL